MPARRFTKPCRDCSAPVEGVKRTDRSSYYYARRCAVCQAKSARGEGHARWKGGRVVGPYGYIYVRVDGHYELEHRVVWRGAHGPIPRGCHIHHKNGIKDDNRIENLELIGAGEHNTLHFSLPGKWSRDYAACIHCGRTDRRHNSHGYCMICDQRRRNGTLDKTALPRPTRDELIEMYVHQGLTSVDIARRYDVNPVTVRAWMGKHGINRRRTGGDKHWLKLRA